VAEMASPSMILVIMPFNHQLPCHARRPAGPCRRLDRD
jgi:hypothetical protein